MVNWGKQIKKCFPQLLKSFITCPSSAGTFNALLLPLAVIIFCPLNCRTASFKITIEGPSGMINFYKRKAKIKPEGEIGASLTRLDIIGEINAINFNEKSLAAFLIYVLRIN